ncbi:MAG: hypothetical protein ACO3P9_00165 [Phycisphaerales bacterium]|jgi:hypothetical protein
MLANLAPSSTTIFDGSVALVAAIGGDGRWTPSIGDPSVMGWITVGGYLLAAAACLWWAVGTGRGRRTVPVAIAAIAAALAINKQLDLQSLLTQTARDLLEGADLYESRRTLQAIFIGVFASGGVAVLGVMLWWSRRRMAESGLALVGLATLLVFVAIRAASFHSIDSGLGQELAGMRLNWILELGGIGLVGMGGLVGRFQGRRGLRGTSRRLVNQIDAPTAAADESSAKASSSPGPAERVADLPRIVRSSPVEAGEGMRGPADGFVVRPIRISEGPAVRLARRQREGAERQGRREEMGPRRLVP